MRAVRYSETGPPEVLEIVELDEPQAGHGEVLVDVRAAGLNPADSKRRRGAIPHEELPSGIGREFAGVVSALGPGADDFRLGDEVIGTGEGVMRERIALPQSLLARKPAELSWEIAATLPVAAQTAWRAVESQHITADDVVLVSAAAGGVGYPAVQFARRLGATVIGTASSTNHPLLERVGAIPVEYGAGLPDRLRALDRRITVVLDFHGSETIDAALEFGVPRERINSVSGVAGRYAVASVGRVGLDRALVERLAAEVVTGRLDIRIEATFPMDRVVDAYRRLETGHLSGKVVLTLP